MGLALFSGFFVSLGLILAIGAQNAFVLRQGLRREHVGAVVLTCAISDALLIAIGVAGFGALAGQAAWLGEVMRIVSAAFLIGYGALSFRAALKGGEALRPADSGPAPIGQVIATTLLLTWANPHVYLDTLMLIGSISAQYVPHAAAFGIGAATASFAFFLALGYGARLLGPFFARPRAWVALEVAVGITMWTIAAGLIVNG